MDDRRADALIEIGNELFFDIDGQQVGVGQRRGGGNDDNGRWRGRRRGRRGRVGGEIDAAGGQKEHRHPRHKQLAKTFSHGIGYRANGGVAPRMGDYTSRSAKAGSAAVPPVCQNNTRWPRVKAPQRMRSISPPIARPV